jgi:L-ribulose-5-phosphate 4-epimerase
MIEELKKDVFHANIELAASGLVILTWGNVSGISRGDGLVVIKPSGINYDAMTVSDMVVVDLNGTVVEGNRLPSSDTPTHLELYKAFPGVGGIAHTHSSYATMFAQACRGIPCLGTTHADLFDGAIPVTRMLTEGEVSDDYERNTGKVIMEQYQQIDPMRIPGVLVAGHAPFTWGVSAADAVKNSLILEKIAGLAFGTLQIDPHVHGLPEYIQAKHYQRKHGTNAYYGQKKS